MVTANYVNGINTYLNNINYKTARAMNEAVNVNNQDKKQGQERKQNLLEDEILQSNKHNKNNDNIKIEKTKMKPPAYGLGGIMNFKV